MRKVLVLIGLAFVSFAGMARAQEGAPVTADPTVVPIGDPAAPVATPAVVAPAGYPDEYALRPIGVAAGMVEVKVPVVINLSKSMVAKPISVPLEVRYGVSNELELRIFHDSVEPMLPGGVCLGGKDRGCGKFYNNVGVGAGYSFLKNNGLELAGLGALEIADIDQSFADLQVGLGVKYITGAISVAAAPKVYIGLNKRDKGNLKQVIGVPVEVAFQANPQLAPFIRTGIMGSTDKFGDNYVIPVGIGANYLLQHGLDLGAVFSMPMAATGRSGITGTDFRSLTIYAAWRNL